MTTANNLRGVALAATAFFLYAAGDASAKHLAQSLDPLQIAFVRQAGLLVGALAILIRQGRGVLTSGRPALQLLRGVLAAVSVTAFILAIAHIPLADASAMTFLAPLFVTILAALVLGERVGAARWIAVGFCFIGTLVIVRPGAGLAHPAAGFAILAAVCFAARQILSRTLSGVDSFSTTLVYSAVTASVLLGVAQPFVWRDPSDLIAWSLLALIAATAGLAEFMLIRALDIANAVAIAPVQYTHIIWTTFYGWLFFDQLPDAWTAFGVAIIVIAGLFMLKLERRTTRFG